MPEMESWPKDLRAAVEARIEKFWEAAGDFYDCVDNRRICRVGDRAEEAAYLEAETSGCCGSHEEKWDVDGVQVRYGFNYGH